MIIILNMNSSMSLERVYRIRKLIQSEECSGYDIDGLTDRLRIHHNSADPKKAESIRLYDLTLKYWNHMKQRRVSPDNLGDNDNDNEDPELKIDDY